MKKRISIFIRQTFCTIIMSNKPLTKDSEFTVGENRLMAYAIAVFFFILFMVAVVDVVERRFRSIDYQSIIFAFAIFGTIYMLRRAKSRAIYIRVNKKGIYEGGQLVTDWPHFLNAYISQDDKKAIYDIRDLFVLIVEYTKDGSPNGFRRKVPLSNNQNKSEEEVLEAVKFFWNEYRREMYQGF
ncbi:MAG: hypothetical protein JNM19_03535 [Chitinophagaceae bacterium]|nr:hypothetical protein [Chitinophagaceae bacterium]